MVYSLDLERAALGALIRNPDTFYKIDAVISELDFYLKNHQTIYSVIKNTLLKQEKIDKILIAEKIKSLGIKFNGDINVSDYLEDISFAPATPSQTEKYFKELSLLRVRREIFEIGENLKQTVSKGEFTSFNEIISKADSIYNQTIRNYSDVDAPVDIFETLEEVIEEAGNNPVKDYGFMTPFPEFNRLYGGLRPKNLYAFASRAGGSKSTLLMNLAFGCHKIDNDINILYLDTEMETRDVQLRLGAAISGVPFWYLDTGNFRKNSEMISKERAAISGIKKKHRFYHYQVANKPIDEVVSMIRRWYYSKAKRGSKAIICLDYLKLTGEKVGPNLNETAIMGEKVDKLKKIAEEINCPILTAIQLNRSAEGGPNRTAGTFSDDSSAFALTDRLQWFASFTAIFRQKTLEEVASDSMEFGTHKMIVTKSRFQGRDAVGFNNFLKRKMPDGSERYVSNYINFDVSNFRVTEKGTLQDIIERQDHDYDLKDDKTPNEKLLD